MCESNKIKNNIQHFIVIGMDDNQSQSFSQEVMAEIRQHHIFTGGKRHHEIVKDLLPNDSIWINITVPLEKVFKEYVSYPEIIVFASGDPLFFGFANTIQKKLPEASISLYPSFNSLQILAHRLLMPYHDMKIVSLTGRPWHELDKALIERTDKIGVLTDGEHTPAAIAQRMAEFGYTYYNIAVGEHLGNKAKERIYKLSLAETAIRDFKRPNCVIITKERYPENRLTELPRYFGIPDRLFEHLDGREKMITKSSIRLLTLSALNLADKTSFWDIGFCTGSISIEAKLLFPHLHITSFEIRQEGQHLMKTNSHRFGAPGITAVIGDFRTTPLTNYTRPDAVFIGGHGGKLNEILKRAVSVLLPKGIIVFNSVSEESRQLFIEAVKLEGLQLLPSLHVAINDYNPIDIMICQKD